jgi:thiosulfate/3-mercaptopyruvate sulfurtransferase
MSVDRPPEANVTFTPRANAEFLCTLQDGVSAIDDRDTVFLDVRSDGEWEGVNDRGNRRAGRIPGAVHLEWVNFMMNDRHRGFKPASQLRALLEATGATPDKNVVAY